MGVKEAGDCSVEGTVVLGENGGCGLEQTNVTSFLVFPMKGVTFPCPAMGASPLGGFFS